MSRSYELELRVKGIEEDVIIKYVKETFDTSIDILETTTSENEVVLSGTIDVTLCGGMMEDEAHKEISDYFKSINPDALINTHWIDLENLPYEEYGDDF